MSPAGYTKMTTIRKAYADTSLGQIHYRHTAEGRNKYPILFLHMSASSSACFERLMNVFSSQGYQCVAPDMPGFGQSFDPLSDPPAISWYIDLYLEVFSGLATFEHGCHVVGHHSGGVIGVEFAVSHPGFVRTLTICGPVLMEKEQREAMRAKVTVPFNRPVPDGSHWLKTWEYLQHHGGIPADDLEVLQQETLDHARAWRGRIQIYNCVWDHDGPALFRRVACPVLALCAPDDVLWSAFGAVKTLRPDVQTAEVTGANFGPSRGAERMAEVLTPFLRDFESREG
jgi:pimeloyl-ACP methyl ester carboxylesterase